MGKFTIFAILALALVTCYWLATTLHTDEEHADISGGSPGERYYSMRDTDTGALMEFDLVDPEMAPESMLAKIMFGYHLILDTDRHAPDYVGNKLCCNNCHFNGGNNLGGKNRGISLVGVTEMYPRFSKRDNKPLTLTDRINNCFKRSMNGVQPPADSWEVQSLLAYLAWISHEVVNAPEYPWLGLDPIVSKHVPDAKNGEKVYKDTCAICHGIDGNGTEGCPPVWGPNSYNDGAGMNMMPMLSSFVWQNMPRGQPTLTPEEALDVSAYVISQPRPHFDAGKK